MSILPKTRNLIGKPRYRSHLFSKLPGSNYNHAGHVGQAKWKANCGKLSVEFNSLRISAHKERLALKHGQIQVEK